jgi:hypothetical protein
MIDNGSDFADDFDRRSEAEQSRLDLHQLAVDLTWR